MLGAIIGDLAAWTYEHDKNLFYAELVHPEAKLSEVGLAVLSMFRLMTEQHSTMEWKDMKRHFCQVYPLHSDKVADIDTIWGKFLRREPGIPEEVKRVMNVATDIVGGWLNEPRKTAAQWGVRFHGCKEEIYLTQISEIIYSLRHGATKKDAIAKTQFIPVWFKPEAGKTEVSPLGYACLAWHCFKDSFDFTSALHNAMRCPYGNKRVLGALTGALAEAMYGCEFMLLKKKYSPDGNWYHQINLPESVTGRFNEEFDAIRVYEKQHRVFFPKNSSLTNVERHHWVKSRIPFYGQVLSDEDRNHLMAAGYTGWENRHGIYLDDGWFYCYRSRFLLLRFKLEQCKEHQWHLVDIQLSGEMDYKTCVIALIDALMETCMVSVNNQTREYYLGLGLCRFFNGEDNPPSNLNTEESVFWSLERMYYCERYPDGEQRNRWEHDAMTICLEDREIADFMQCEKIPMGVKGMVSFCIQDLMYHSPMSGAKAAYEYAAFIGRIYGIKQN